MSIRQETAINNLFKAIERNRRNKAVRRIKKRDWVKFKGTDDDKPPNGYELSEW